MDPMMTLDNRHALAVPYWARPGLRFMAKAADDGTGAGGDDEDDDDEDDDDEDDDEDDDPDAEKTEDELRAELKSVRQALGKANGQSAKRRKRERDLKAQLEAAQAARVAKGKKADDDDELDVEAVREAAKLEGKKAGEVLVKKAEVKAALARAGITDPKAAKRLVGMVNLDDLDVDEDGEVEGVDDAVELLRDELPALFEKPRRKRESVAGAGDRGDKSDRGPGGRQTKSASERQADILLGRAGR